YVHQTSWGLSTRIIGAIIMVHGDDSGLILPPKIAPVQVDIIPIQQQKEGVLEKANELKNRLKGRFTVKIDDADKSPGWKFAEQEMRGIPVRIEIGPKDIEQGQCVIVRRDTRDKYTVALDAVEDELVKILDTMQKEMYERALKHRDSHVSDAKTYDEFKDIIENKPGFVRAMWCEGLDCELKIKEETTATSRCIPFVQEKISDVCVCCGKPATKMVYWGKAY
ncbi:MAG: proline--tRNA ligase, partial [Lachnospiraceae bacterium]|nr:proline--tRNA ligase [Lachnospiraceae bacterium]